MSMSGKTVKLLVIDDDDAVRLFLKKVVKENFGFEIIEASDGLDGLVKVKEELPDIILLDISMPVLSGIDFLEGIRGDKRFSRLPVLVLTGNKDEETVHALLKQNIHAYIVKPLEYYSTLEKFTKIFPQLEDLIQINRAYREREYKTKILLVDEDQDFHGKFGKMFGTDIDIVNSSSGTDCLKSYLEHHPEIVCLGDNLGIVNKDMVAKKIREYDRYKISKIFLCTEQDKSETASEEIFDGVIEKKCTAEQYHKILFS